MKIVTWNVNSIRKRLDIVVAWIEAHQPDVLLLQETKVTDELFPQAPFIERGLQVAIHGQKSLNGVAIIAKSPIEDVMTGLPGDPEDAQARYIEATINGVRIASVYVPNGTQVGSDKFAFKMAFFDRMQTHLGRLASADQPLLVGGDYNVAPDERDVYDPDDCAGDICFHDAERAKWRALTHLGLYDGYRAVHPTKRQYSWWDMRGGAWEKGEGMRIDHFLCSAPALDRIIDADADAQARAGQGVSDHVPVWVELAA